jgi:hypothetical protein
MNNCNGHFYTLALKYFHEDYAKNCAEYIRRIFPNGDPDEITQAIDCVLKDITEREEVIMSEFKKYVRKDFSEMRSYIPGEDMSNISVSDVDIVGKGGMIARNPQNYNDQWYVAEQYFKDNLKLADTV